MSESSRDTYGSVDIIYCLFDVYDVIYNCKQSIKSIKGRILQLMYRRKIYMACCSGTTRRSNGEVYWIYLNIIYTSLSYVNELVYIVKSTEDVLCMVGYHIKKILEKRYLCMILFLHSLYYIAVYGMHWSTLFTYDEYYHVSCQSDQYICSILQVMDMYYIIHWFIQGC